MRLLAAKNPNWRRHLVASIVEAPYFLNCSWINLHGAWANKLIG